MKQQILRLGENTVVYGIGSVLPRFIGLLLLPVFTAYLDPEEYGVLAILGVLTMIAHPVFALGISTAMGPSYFATSSNETRFQTVWTAFGILALSSAVLVMIGWLIPETLGRLILLPAQHADLISLTLTGCALTIVATPLMQWVQFEEQARRFVAITTVSAVFVSALSVLTVVSLGLGAKGIVLSQLAGNAITLVAFLWLALKETKPQWNRAIGNELTRLGVRMIPSAGLLFVLMHLNKQFIQWLGGLEQLGVYAVGFNIASVISIVVNAIATSWYPFFMSFLPKQAEAEVLFGRIFTYYVFGGGYLSLLFFIFAKPLVIGMTAPRYWDASGVIGLVSLAYFFLGAFNLLLPGLYFAKEVSLVTIIQAAAAVISLPLNILMIIYFGFVGAAIGVAASHLLMALLTHLWNRHRRAIYPNIRYEWRRMRTFAIGAAGIAFVTMGTTTGALGRELMRSVPLWLLATMLVYFCLNAQERLALGAKLRLLTHASH